jgi:anaerobic magnesium-protoporphyrin IX monomethyl ester cyclase
MFEHFTAIIGNYGKKCFLLWHLWSSPAIYTKFLFTPKRLLVILALMRILLATLHSKFIHASLALPYLAAYCSDLGQFVIREFTIHEPRENILAMILAEEPDVVAFSVYLWNRRETFDLIDALGVVRPDLRIVVGGPEVSFEAPSLFDRHPGLNALIRGEGELPFRGLLQAWVKGEKPSQVPRLMWREENQGGQGPDTPPIKDLDVIPSPFALGLIDLDRGFVYYETSRGCPYRCAFCLSARDERVRAFSMERVRSDLRLLMDHEVPKIKLVDRTFNYDAKRAREIFREILTHNRGSHFHFEIGAHLLDEATLNLLEEVPPGMFQFEIGVQSTLPGTLSAINRKASLELLETNVRRLREKSNVTLHLDLIVGLPGEGYTDFLKSLDRVAALRPHHLQIEPVKLLPGTPLRGQAPELQLKFDPNPPYTVLRSPDLDHTDLERFRGISRLLDLTYNAGRLERFLDGLQKAAGSLSAALEQLENYWRQEGLLRFPLSQKAVFEHLARFVSQGFSAPLQNMLREQLARDFAHCERVVPGNAPDFFDSRLRPQEQQRVHRLVQEETARVKGQGVKIQFFAAAFHHLEGLDERRIILFIYETASGRGLKVKEIRL